MLKLFSKNETVSEPAFTVETPKSNYDEALNDISEFNRAAREKSLTYVPSIALRHGASESFIESIDGKDMFIRISSIEAIQSSGGGEQHIRAFPSYFVESPTTYYPVGGITKITITTKAAIVYSTSIEYTCADVLLKALRGIWIDGVADK